MVTLQDVAQGLKTGSSKKMIEVVAFLGGTPVTSIRALLAGFIRLARPLAPIDLKVDTGFFVWADPGLGTYFAAGAGLSPKDISGAPTEVFVPFRVTVTASERWVPDKTGGGNHLESATVVVQAEDASIWKVHIAPVIDTFIDYTFAVQAFNKYGSSPVSQLSFPHTDSDSSGTSVSVDSDICLDGDGNPVECPPEDEGF